ncbi:Serine/threonine-protein kinase PknD [bioreactor metagenome]|uniref:Serine/threonine-protein kinase PknD n=1 Tax=bioreactor metagenome TaxID=1076179 RepID=A0A644XKX5_9ZZZZ
MNPELLCMRCMSSLHEPNGVCPVCGFANAAAQNAPNQLDCGSILAGTYLVGCVLGQGGFGITYIGWDLNLGIKVAIKEYYPEGCVLRDIHTYSDVRPLPGARGEAFLSGKEHFVREAQILARFSGEPGVIGVRAFFQENGTAYIVMDYAEGETLKKYVSSRGGKLSATETLALFRPLVLSLMRVHEAGLLHRDISPDNIIRRPDGTLVLLDFGAARQMSMSGEHSNTINVKHGFAPEEQYRTHGEQGPWTDIYALCATIYRLTTGVTPPNALDRLMSESGLIPPNALGADFTNTQQNAILHGLKVRVSERTRSLQQLEKELFGEGYKDRKDDKRSRNRWKQAAILGFSACLIACIALVILLNKDRSHSAESPTTNTQLDSAEATIAPTSEPTVKAALESSPAPAQELPGSNTLPETFEWPHSSAQANVQAYRGLIAAGADFTLAVKSDGTVVRLGGSGIHTKDWTEIVQISAYEFTVIALRSDGTVLVTGESDHGEDNVGSWKDIIQVDCGFQHSVGLSKTGQVYFTGNNKGNRAGCEGWTNLYEIDAGAEHIIGICNDGTVLSAGYDDLGQCDTESFQDIVGGDVGGTSTFCIRSDGTVIALGKDWVGEDDVGDWTDIVAIAAADEHTVGLKSDGTVVAVGSNRYGECNVSGWTDIVAIAAGRRHTVGLKSDGTLVATGSNSTGQCNVTGIKLW